MMNTVTHVAPNAIVPDGMGLVGANHVAAPTNPRAGASPAPTKLPSSNVGGIIGSHKSLLNAAILESLERVKI